MLPAPPDDVVQVLGGAMENQFTAERLRESRGWFMVMVGFVVLLFTLLLAGSTSSFLFYFISPVALLFGVFGVFEIRPVRYLRQKIDMDLEAGARENVEGVLESSQHVGGKGMAGKYYWIVGGKQVRIPPALFESVQEGRHLRIERGRYSKTVLEIQLLESESEDQAGQ
ncbi:hypothetical protein KKF84_20025 [Myxococcota bacterium]|nr:hypothetical protein [Myxococcota bacterium]MBU1537613.1 hypothetical protein [Myxococcota bacterium]